MAVNGGQESSESLTGFKPFWVNFPTSQGMKSHLQLRRFYFFMFRFVKQLASK